MNDDGAPVPDAAAASAPIDLDQIGTRICELRQERRLTLDQLAQATGFTKSYLSKIEHMHKTPPIGTLARIAQALGVELAEFFQGPGGADPVQSVSVVRASERQASTRGGGAFGYDYVSLAHKRRRKHMEPFIFTYPPDIDRGVYFEHDGEEFLFVLEGRIEFEVGGDREGGKGGEWRKWILHPGDSIYFDSRTPHKGRGVDGDARALVVVYAPDTRG